MRSIAFKAYAAFREGRLSRSPADWFRLVRLHYRELAQRQSSAPSAAPRATLASSRGAGPLDRSILDELIASGGRLRFAEAKPPLVSVLMAVHNRAELTLRCLRSLTSTDIPIEIVIVDNGSTDETTALLAHLDGVGVIINAVNVGFLPAVNQAARRATGELLLLLNNDTDVLPGSLEAAVETLMASPSAGAVVGKLIHPDGRLQEAGSIIWSDGSCEGYGRGDDPLSPPYMFRRDVDFGSGAFLLTRRSVFLEGGGFDDRYAPAYYEDADYCVRLWKSGLRVIYDPRAVIVHSEFASAASSADAVAQQAERRTVFNARHRDWLEVNARPPGTQALHARARLARGQRLLLIDDRIPHDRLGSGYPRSLSPCASCARTGPPRDGVSSRGSRRAMGRGVLGSSAGSRVVPRVRAGRPRAFPRGSLFVLRRHHREPAAQHAGRPRLASRRANGKRPALVYDAEALFAFREIGRRQVEGSSLTDEQAARMVAREISIASGSDLVLTVSLAERQHFLNAGHHRRQSAGEQSHPAAHEA